MLVPSLRGGSVLLPQILSFRTKLDFFCTFCNIGAILGVINLPFAQTCLQYIGYCT
jgi:hypothetical protein